MIYKKAGFSLAEALMALLVVSLIVSAMIPVLSRKHRDVGVHGKWECTLNAQGQHVVRTIVSGKDSGFQLSGNGSSCTFNPPSNVDNFAVKVIGGGGGGAGGQAGDSKDTEINADKDIKTHAAPFTGKYSIALQGGGGAGGGMACGFAKDHLPTLTFASTGGVYGNPGYKDGPAPGFPYDDLYANDSSKYSKYVSTPTGRDLCFAEKGWTNEEKDDDKCWNYPGQGGGAGISRNLVAKFNKGDLITLAPPDEGMPKGEGGPGGDGGAACYMGPNGVKECAGGGTGGYNRYLTTVKYNVDVCYYKGYDTICYRPETYGCQVKDDNSCTENCSTHWDPSGCTRQVPYGCVQYEPCVVQKRTNYFDVTACINDLGSGMQTGFNAYHPGLANITSENGDEIGGAGSGGMGANRITISEDTESNPGLATEPFGFYNGRGASTGHAILRYVTYSGGGGGQAGEFVYSLFKKLPRVTNIKIGAGGRAVGWLSDGQNGLATEFGDLLKAQGGMGGRKMTNYPDLTKGETKAAGGDGYPSPLDSGVFKDFIIARGGYSGDNTDINGYGMSTFMWKLLEGLTVGGKLSQYTYGAGGGGGGGTTGLAGNGGAGAPGAVIIEW